MTATSTVSDPVSDGSGRQGDRAVPKAILDGFGPASIGLAKPFQSCPRSAACSSWCRRRLALLDINEALITPMVTTAIIKVDRALISGLTPKSDGGKDFDRQGGG